ncbi:MAG: thermonuclease family protein [Planctomycetaceae bacterium]|jgi:micrococcal nuclease|nr:thermonuclease family protein [Planctomycetaceae bacterium]MDG2389934.1 thermonuclease family protein [Planctomycetaceae bacterium]
MSRPFSTREKLQLLAGSPQRILVLLAIVVVIASSRWLFPPAPQPAPLIADADYRVLRVIDGDTVLLADQTRIRLIGINTPELERDGRTAEAWSQESKDWLRHQLEDETVRLEFDIERFDQYDRTLAYVYLGETLINEEVIRQGFSRAEIRYPFSDRMKRKFRRAEELAREARRGIWENDRDEPFGQ